MNEQKKRAYHIVDGPAKNMPSFDGETGRCLLCGAEREIPCRRPIVENCPRWDAHRRAGRSEGQGEP